MSSFQCSLVNADPGEEQSPLGGVLKDIINTLGSGGRFTVEDVTALWGEVVGKAASKHSRPVSLKRGQLTVNVDGSSWLYELSTKKRELLKGLSGGVKGKKIKDVRLRIGDIKRA